MYKKNSRDSSKSKGCSPLQLSCNLTGKCHAVGYYSYTNRWAQLKIRPYQKEKYQRKNIWTFTI
jgi:predicted aconitase